MFGVPGSISLSGTPFHIPAPIVVSSWDRGQAFALSKESGQARSYPALIDKASASVCVPVRHHRIGLAVAAAPLWWGGGFCTPKEALFIQVTA